ncbi:helix-turn-helix transcriptional regulator [Sphingobacterium sp. KU25419]|nr:helix-turn-helix transcriptional regulator [Sphingobacterium sp. KU25419]
MMPDQRSSMLKNPCFRGLTRNHTTAKIGEQMFISPLTVESHRRNLLQKFGVVNSASLIHKATEMKFI